MLVTSLLLFSPVLPAPPQDRLFMLGRQGKISEVHYAAPQGPPTELITTYQLPGIFPSGLEVDRTTGEFLVLVPDWTDQDGRSEIYRVDPITGQTNGVHAMVGDLYGLEQGLDGEFFSTSRRGGLVRIDLTTNTSETIAYNGPDSDAVFTFYSGLAMRNDGLLEGGNSERWTIDPASGDVELIEWDAGAASLPVSVATLSYEIGPDGSRYVVAPNHGLVIIAPDLQSGVLRDDLGPAQYVFGLCFGGATHNEGFETVCEGNANSEGQAATLEFIGTTEIAENSLELYSRRLPENSFGYFVTGPNTGMTPVGSGTLCISSPFYRYSQFPLDSGDAGIVRFDIDLLSIPSGGVAVAGRVDVFQYWYRDVGGTSNLSNALAVTMR